MVWLLAVAGCGDDGGEPPAGDGGPPATCSDGMLSGDETDVDCGGSCEACPLDAECAVNADCKSLRCTGGTCRPPESCFDFELTEGETDVDCGGALCPGCRLMGGCVEASDCLSGNCSEDGVCVAECDDGIRNGTESDVDCGGSCAGCEGGLVCAEDEDCTSGLCEAGTCASAACDDGVRNGAETDVDCGGPCDPCPGGGGCAVDGDCVTLVCMEGMCAATTCTNGIVDGDESDVDCGGADCPGCLPGEACGDAADCGGNPCTGGTCESGESCLALLALDPTLESGTYTVEPSAGEYHRVYCDMETAGGGWTLVGSSEGDPMNDQAQDYYPNLQTLFPEGSARGVWDGMRPIVGEAGDTRFTCKRNPRNDQFDVDLIFYESRMYDEITSGTDGETCFFVEAPGEDDLSIVPPRSNQLAAEGEVGVQRRLEPHGEDGRLVGEDACGDPGDFTVDFDDRGVGGNQADGTDWGETNSLRKCGTSGLGGGAWFVWVRESNPECGDGAVSGFESDADCGGPCAPCADDLACVLDGDCASLACSDETGLCVGPCQNGILDADESDADCGGVCPLGCGLKRACAEDTDCDAAYVCDAGLCLPSHCSNATVDGDETDLDCGGSCRLCAAGLACLADTDCETERCLDGICARCAGEVFRETESYIGCESTVETPTCPDVSGTGTGLSLSDDSATSVSLPFTFQFFGRDQTSIWVGSNGVLSFGTALTSFSNSCLPRSGTPADILAPFWDDLNPSRGGSVTWEAVGTAPNRELVVQYAIFPFTSVATDTLDVRVVLYEGSNEIRVCYVDTDVGTASVNEGISATSGIQTSGESLQYSCNSSVLDEGLELVYTPL